MTPSTWRRSASSSATARTPTARRKAKPGEEVADPYFGGAGPVPQGLHRVRRVHDRLPARREEHPQRELPAPRREGRRGRPPHDHGRRRSPTTRAAATPSPPCPPTTEARSKGRTLTARRVVIAAGTYGTQTLLHRMKAGGQLPYLSDRLGELTRTNSEALVGAQTDDRRYRKAHGAREGRLHPGRRHHLLHPPRRQHPHRAGPLRQGLQLDGRPVHPPGAVRRTNRRRGSWAGSATRRSTRCWCCARSPTAAGRSGPSSAW